MDGGQSTERGGEGDGEDGDVSSERLGRWLLAERGAEGVSERAEVQGDRRLATAAAYEVIAEPMPSQEADTKGGSSTGNRRRRSRIATREASAVGVAARTRTRSCLPSQCGIGANHGQSSAPHA